jgi:predicted XRE-type DNA-binding protein
MKPKRHYKNSNPRTAMEIRDLYFKRIFKQTEIARIYGIPQSSVSKTVSGVVWQ